MIGVMVYKLNENDLSCSRSLGSLLPSLCYFFVALRLRFRKVPIDSSFILPTVSTDRRFLAYLVRSVIVWLT